MVSKAYESCELYTLYASADAWTLWTLRPVSIGTLGGIYTSQGEVGAGGPVNR